MSRLDDCCFRCACDPRIVRCGDRGDDCGCLDEPTCQDCHNFHFDLVPADVDAAYADWLRMGMTA